MPLGPIEIIVISFPENLFTGDILPELKRVVENETITIVDGLFVSMDSNGVASYAEFDELSANEDVAPFARLLDRVEGLVSDEDVVALTAELDPNSSAAILVFEHTWVKPLRDSIFAAGGVMLETIRIPGAAVEEVLAAVSELD